MKSRVSSLAQRIRSIKEEFSENEIRRALRLLEQESSSSPLFADLANGKRGSRRRLTPSRRNKKPQDQRSQAVISLERKDPEKYRVLSEFDSLLRKGAVLPKVNDIRRLGESLTKDFTSKRSRRESISKLMAVLADRPFNEITAVVNAILSNGELDNDESDYQRLAHFIITGKASPSIRESRSRPS